ncbi:MAG: hypothetical protein IKX00_03340 [Bacilli bacterium]|nr:hypothetical protein [Bacilli bacterium]
MKIKEENGIVLLYDENDKPIYFANEESELAFLRGKYNLCTSEINRIEKLVVNRGVFGLTDQDRTAYTDATKMRDLICEYMTKKNIDYGEIDPNTGLIVEGPIRN